jgi:hypothetical protein
VFSGSPARHPLTSGLCSADPTRMVCTLTAIQLPIIERSAMGGGQISGRSPVAMEPVVDHPAVGG